MFYQVLLEKQQIAGNALSKFLEPQAIHTENIISDV